MYFQAQELMLGEINTQKKYLKHMPYNERC